MQSSICSWLDGLQPCALAVVLKILIMLILYSVCINKQTHIIMVYSLELESFQVIPLTGWTQGYLTKVQFSTHGLTYALTWWVKCIVNCMNPRCFLGILSLKTRALSKHASLRESAVYTLQRNPMIWGYGNVAGGDRSGTLKSSLPRAHLEKAVRSLENGQVFLSFSSKNSMYILNILDIEDKFREIGLKSCIDQADIQWSSCLSVPIARMTGVQQQLIHSLP